LIETGRNRSSPVDRDDRSYRIEIITDQDHLAENEGMTEVVDHLVDLADLVDQVDLASQVNQTIRICQNCQMKT
jgi:hypothetical protein